MNAYDIIRQLGGRLIDPRPEHAWPSCPSCGVKVPPEPNGVRRLCRLCTEREIGEPTDELTARISRRMTRKAYLALPRDNDGKPILPALSYRDWRRLQG